MQRKQQLAVTGVFTVAAAAVIAVGIALSGGQPAEQPDTTPAGQVDGLPESVASTTTPSFTAAAPSTTVPQDAPPPADDGPVNSPAPNAPTEDVPPPGTPYDSDGYTVVPNPPDLGPGEVAPRPPTQTPVEPPPAPPEVPVIPTAGGAPAGS